MHYGCLLFFRRSGDMHWPCVTDFSGLSTYGLNGYEREMSTPPTLRGGTVDLPFAFALLFF